MYYHQATTTTTATKWNGNSWVQSTTPSINPYASQPSTAAPSFPQNPSSAPNPVTVQQQQQAINQYTEYHKHWSAQAKTQRAKADSLMPGPEKDELVRHAAWAEHYATLSIQAIQYYQSLSIGSAVVKLQQPSMGSAVVKPQQPVSTQDTTYTGQKQSIGGGVVQPSASQESKPNQQPTSTVAGFASLKHFNQRALSQCKTSQEKEQMQKLVNKVIADAKKSKTLFSTDWTKVPVPTLVVDKGNSDRFSLSYSQQQPRKRLSSPSSFDDPPLKKTNISDIAYLRDEEKPNLDDFIPLKNSKKPKKEKKKNTLGSGFEKSSNALNRRASRFSDKLGTEVSSTIEDFGRFMGTSVIGGNSLDESDYEHMTVKGTCTKLEKEYLRLTAPPKAEAVRPQPILELHLSNLKLSFRNQKVEYNYLCSQFKAIRQDLTVQRIFNSFSVEVYETHARIALEKNDLNEYNQCQTQLKELYDVLGRKGVVDALKNQNEFIAYRIIYYVFLTGFNKKYEGGSSDIFKIMLSLNASQRKDPIIMFALKVRVTVADNDYHAFFRLHYESPLMCAYLMDYMVPTMRLLGLQRICKAYRPSVSLNFVISELGFLCPDEDSKNKLKQGRKWIESCGGKIDNSELLTKDSEISAPSDTEAKNSLI